MTGSPFSTAWYRVAALTPRVRSHAQFHRHQYRGQIWYVLRDLASERLHRFSPAGHLIIGLMDGRRTVQEIWDVATARLGDDAPTQDEMIQLLAQLHAADVLQSDVAPDTAELFERWQRYERRSLAARWLSPLSWRIPLVDPQRFLRWLLPAVRPFFGVLGGLLWLAVVGPAVLLAALHWGDLSASFLDRVLAPQHAVLLWLTFPVIKTLHELGHAFAVEAFGGEVHDMGVMLLVFTPVPYVEASSSAAFPSKWQRIVVGAGGMLVELFLAALAMFFWVAAEPGVARTLAYNMLVIAGVSTVLFNANPLLRYDGYYMLADLLEIPNLYTRSRAFVLSLVRRHLLGERDTPVPDASPGERVWFVAYATASFVYRVLVVAGIMLFVMWKSFYLGAALALFSLGAWLVRPAARAVSYLARSPRLRRRRLRAITASALLAALVVALVGLVPVPFRSRAEGVVWVPDEAVARAETEGFVERVVAPSGARVRPGDALVILTDPVLDARARVLAARQRELQARYDAERPTDPVRAEIVREELLYAGQQLGRVRERLAGLEIRARAAGTLVIPDAQNLPGRFVKKGESLGWVVDLDTITVRTVVPQADIDLVRQRTREVEVRLSERLAAPLRARITREVPGGSEALPTAALGSAGGGVVIADPKDPSGRTAVARVFQVDLELPAQAGLLNVGGRVYVRFDHGQAPLAAQWYRQLRQLFLAQFNV